MNGKPGRTLTIALVLSVISFVVLQVFGVWGPVLISNQLCFRWFGCNAGFFGYDAIIHTVSAVMEVLFIVWLMKMYPRISMLTDSRLKNVIMLVSLVALLAVIWELGEFLQDRYFMYVLHIDLLHPVNALSQPSNIDTMGDEFFSLFGATIAAWITMLYKAKG